MRDLNNAHIESILFNYYRTIVTKILAYILTGLLFSFPFLSPAQGMNVVPSVQIGYLSLLQTNEEKNKTTGPDDYNRLNIIKESPEKRSNTKSVVTKVVKHLKTFADAFRTVTGTAGRILQNQCLSAIQETNHHKYHTLLSVRSVVLRR